MGLVDLSTEKLRDFVIKLVVLVPMEFLNYEKVSTAYIKRLF